MSDSGSSNRLLPVRDKAELSPLDLSLPYINLPECADIIALRRKFAEETIEWSREPTGSDAETHEAWDRVQCAHTALNHPDMDTLEVDRYIEAKGVIERYHKQGRDVIKAKAEMLVKNASRKRPGGGYGYYDNETCRIILNSGGKRFA